jgi:hypothetical protein
VTHQLVDHRRDARPIGPRYFRLGSRVALDRLGRHRPDSNPPGHRLTTQLMAPLRC